MRVFLPEKADAQEEGFLVTSLLGLTPERLASLTVA